MEGFFKYWRGHLLKLIGIAILIYWCVIADEVLILKWVPALILIYFLSMQICLSLVSRRAQSKKFLELEERKLREYASFLKKYPWALILVPGEDGLFLVPIVASGFRPDVTIISSLIFGILHLKSRSLADCLVLSLVYGLLAFFIIPMSGILAWSVAHLALDLIVVAIICFFMKNEEK